MNIIVIYEDEWNSLSEEQKSEVKFNNDQIEIVYENGMTETIVNNSVILGEE